MERWSLRCNVGGVPTLWGENPGQFPYCVAHGVPPALPQERQCDRETLFFEDCYRVGQTLNVAPGYLVESRRFIRGVTASFGVNLLCCGLHYFNAGATRLGGWVTTFSGVPERVTKWLRHVRPHGGRTRAAVLVPIRPEENLLAQRGTSPRVWVLMREASRRGFAPPSGGGLRPRAGALRSAGTHAAQRRCLPRGMAVRRRVEHPWIPFRSECEGMRRDQSSPGHFQKFMRTKVCHYAPSSEGALRRGITPWIGARCLGKRGRTCGAWLGTGYPEGRKGGTEANRGITTPETP